MKNEYAITINDNRYIAGAQLTADDMGPTTWKQYRQLCDVLALASWKSLLKGSDENEVGLALTGLFAFFGSDAKAMSYYQRRLMLCCVTIKKEQSIAMKKARKALRDAKAKLEEELEAGKAEVEVSALQLKVEEAKELVEKLESEPNNVWYQKTPMLDNTRTHANAKCRKLIEDTIADILNERELMSPEQLQQEALQLKAERKARRQMKNNEGKTANK